MTQCNPTQAFDFLFLKPALDCTEYSGSEISAKDKKKDSLIREKNATPFINKMINRLRQEKVRKC